KMNRIMSEKTGQPLEVIKNDVERDNFMGAEAAIAYGLIDSILEKHAANKE
ncbi:ATP-dependent Clp protease proteolytic subunit, partial [Proteiniclasticum sp.]